MKIRVSMYLAARTGAGWQDTGNPGHDYYEANIRNNLLPQALVALFGLAEVLAAYPREEGFFAWYQGILSIFGGKKWGRLSSLPFGQAGKPAPRAIPPTY